MRFRASKLERATAVSSEPIGQRRDVAKTHMTDYAREQPATLMNGLKVTHSDRWYAVSGTYTYTGEMLLVLPALGAAHAQRQSPRQSYRLVQMRPPQLERVPTSAESPETLEQAQQLLRRSAAAKFMLPEKRLTLSQLSRN